MENQIVPILLALDVISIVPASLVAYFFLRSYKYLRHIPLESLAIGFSILAISYAFVTISALELVPMANTLLLARLAFQTLAFSFIATGYWFWGRGSRAGWVRVTLTAILIFLVILILLYVLWPPPLGLPDFSGLEQYFHGTSLFLLLYVSARAFRNYMARPEMRTAYVPIAFIFLAVGQYTWLIWSVEGGLTSLALAYINRAVGLSLFLKVIFEVAEVRRR